MKTLKGKHVLSLALLMSFCATTPEAHGFWRKKKKNNNFDAQVSVNQAVAVLDVFPFEDKKRALRCTAFHLGDGYAATAGHCFLGSMDCNGARLRWAHSDRVSNCKKVVYSNASEAFPNRGPFSNDLTVFKIDNPPTQRLTISNNAPLWDEPGSLNVQALTAELTANRVHGKTLGNCRMLTGRITSIFGQPKSSDTALHDCAVGEFSAGTPIIDATTKSLIAFHQATSLMPVYDPSSEAGAAMKSVNFAKTITDLDIIRIINSEQMPFRNLRIGGFTNEVFNTGFVDKIAMKVATLEARDNLETVSFIPHSGIDNQLEITGADGAKMIVTGPRRAGFDQRFQFKAPVTIQLKSTHLGIAPSAWLENIQSP